MTKHGLLLALAAVIAGWIFLGFFIVALFWPVKTLEIVGYDPQNPIKVLTKTLRIGDVLEYELKYCKYRDSKAVVHRKLIDGQVITLQDTEENLEVGCHSVTVKTAVIPDTINAGRYYLDVKVDYPINPLRDLFIGPTRTHYRTEYFDVEEPPQKATTVIYGQPTTLIIKNEPVATTTHKSTDSPDIIIKNTPPQNMTPVPTNDSTAPDEPEESGLLKKADELIQALPIKTL